MSPIIENLPNIAKNIQTFYMSSRTNMILDIKLLPPFNEILSLNVYKLSSYQETLNNVISRIKLYLAGFSMFITNNKGIEQKMVFNNAQDRYNYIKIYNSKVFNMYLRENQGLSGKIDF